jgi:hypothetical protein
VTAGLENWEFRRIATGGFGDPLNAYAHSMCWFQDRLYVGTTRANLCLLKSRTPLPATWWPVRCPDEVYDLDLRAQIWCWDPETDKWARVRRSPSVREDASGLRIPFEIGYRAMTLFQGRRDTEPALYVAPWSPPRAGRRSALLRSDDGKRFTPLEVRGPDLGESTASSFRAMTVFEGRLFVSPTSRPGSINVADRPVILASYDPLREDWFAASDPGFGNPDNTTVFELAVLSGHLYAGTMNPETGFEIWRTRARGTPPYAWDRVLDRGAYRGPLNETALSMAAFGEGLYVGTGIQNGGHDLTYGVGPAAPELIRIEKDGNWSLVVGEVRRTPRGFLRPSSGAGPGFDRPSTGYFWRMAEYEGALYLGTLDWSVMLPYMRQSGPPDGRAAGARWLGADNLASFGGFELRRSTDGVNWVPVSTDGFGNPYNFGARTLLGTPRGLFLGTANPFGPEIGARSPAGWIYTTNPRAGAEVWLGDVGTAPRWSDRQELLR